MSLSVVILAAGQGKRMHSDLPKVLHRLAGKTLLEHVVHTAEKICDTPPIVVFGHKGEVVKHTLAHLNVIWVEQKEQLGTGHALQQAISHLPKEGRVLVLYGDVPLTSVDTLKNFIKSTPENALGIITANLPNPSGLGRILRKENNITCVVEDKDATAEQLLIKEINSGIYLIPVKQLSNWLTKLTNNNKQKEYYLTDIIPQAISDKVAIQSLQPAQYQEILGINDRKQLAELERFYQQQQAEKLMLRGVSLLDPNRFDLRGDVTIGRDVVIDVNVILEGHVKIGDRCIIGPNCVLRNTTIANRVEIKANSVLEGAEVGDDCIVGPFARLRPGAQLAAQSHVGNFVEIKNSYLGVGSKANHLTYVGDCEVGSKVNIGAGTITCNYDGVNKHKTIIEDGAFIGSNSSLVAPVRIGEQATIGAGSTITHDAPARKLTLGRAQQCTIENWQRPQKQAKEKES